MKNHLDPPQIPPPTLNGNDMDGWKNMGQNMNVMMKNHQDPPKPPPHPKW